MRVKRKILVSIIVPRSKGTSVGLSYTYENNNIKTNFREVWCENADWI